MLDVSLDPSNVLCVSFSTRDDEDKEQLESHDKQQNYLQLIKETDPQDYKKQETLQQDAGEESEVEKEDSGDEEEKSCVIAIAQPFLQPEKSLKFLLNDDDVSL